VQAVGESALLVVAATGRELVGAAPAASLVCGIGPVEAAARAALGIAEARPRLLLHVGIAGVRRASGIGLLDVVLGSESVYCDSDIAPPLAPDPALLEAAAAALPDALRLAIGTSARVGGTRGTPVEAMEGYAVLRAAQLASVPALEVRVASNEIEEEDRSRWRFDEAFARLAEVTRALVEALRRG
jgi:nucleoside phosphorylase